MLALFGQVTGAIIHSRNPGTYAIYAMLSHFRNLTEYSPLSIHHVDTISHRLEIIAYYVMFLFFYPLIWCVPILLLLSSLPIPFYTPRLARLSILFSIIRIHPIGMRRSYLYLIAGIFALTGTLLVGQGFWVCEPQSEWKAQRTPQCSLDNQVVICQIVCE